MKTIRIGTLTLLEPENATDRAKLERQWTARRVDPGMADRLHAEAERDYIIKKKLRQ